MKLETKITGTDLRTITVFYESPSADWSLLFKEVAALYGLDCEDPKVRFIAVPKGCPI